MAFVGMLISFPDIILRTGSSSILTEGFYAVVFSNGV